MKNLKELREYNILTQKEVAQHIGVSDRVYSYYENGRTLPAKYVKPLANLFGISCDEFLENNVDLADYTKQVRKEVCEEIRSKLKSKERFHAEDDFEIDYDYYDKEDVDKILNEL